MVPFDHALGWRYSTLIVWWLLAFFSIIVSCFLGLVIDKGWKPYAMSMIGAFLSYWWLTWLFCGEPIWHIAEKLNQPL